MIRIPLVSEYNAKGQKEAQKGIKSLDDQVKSLGKAVVAGFAVGQMVDFGKKALNAAVDLNESVNAVNVTFGAASDAILDLGENAASTVGLSASAFNSLAVQLSSFAQQVTPAGASVADTIETMTTRAADFASVMNISVEEAVGVFQSTLAGSSEVARQYGVDVSAAAVEQYVLANGIAESKSEITEADKVLGRYSLLMEGTEKTSGDFANTSDSLANQQRVLKAEFENITAELGQNLIPVMSGLAGVALDVGDAFEQLGLDLGGVSDFSLRDWATGIGRDFRTAFDGTARANWLLSDSIAAAEKSFEELNLEAFATVRTTDDVIEIMEELYGVTDNVVYTQHLANMVFAETVDIRREEEEATRDAMLAISFLTDEQYEQIKAEEEAAQAALDAAAAHDEYMQSIKNVRDEADSLRRSIDMRDELLDTLDAFDEFRDEMAKDQTAREQEQAMIDLKTSVMDYAEELDLPDQVVTMIIAQLDDGKIEEVEDFLTRLGNGVTVPLVPSVISGTTLQYDEFGNVRSNPSLAGAARNPVLPQMTDSGALRPGTTNININVTPGVGDPYSNGLAVADGLTAYQSNNGYIRGIFG